MENRIRTFEIDVVILVTKEYDLSVRCLRFWRHKMYSDIDCARI